MLAAPTILEVKYKNIVVDGKNKKVATIEQQDGTWGYYAKSGSIFDVIVKNELTESTSIHWHGLILPNNQDGVAGVTQNPIAPGQEYHYKFQLKQSGTYWMHSHFGLQIQDLMEAPFIITDSHDSYKADKNVVVMFQDFTFKNPELVLKELKAKPSSENMQQSNMAMTMNSSRDINDVNYDAFLTNYHTLKHPQIVSIKPNTTVRLRFIDGAAGSNFWINLGSLNGTAIAVDGENIKPLQGKMFQIAMGQRIDILVKIPKSGGAFPILGQVEGTNSQTGLILTTDSAHVSEVNESSVHNVTALNYQQEYVLHSIHPLKPKSIDKIVTLDLSGNMQKYIWMINGQVWPNITPIKLKQGERVEIVFDNKSGMAHPMHLHGHVFEPVMIDQHKIIDGALRDTILVLPHSQVKVIFDAGHMGKWLLHCHMEYHAASGMMTVVTITP